MVKGTLYENPPALSRSVLNYVKWKHRAQRSRQVFIAGIILFCTSVLAILLFLLLVSDVIPTAHLGKEISLEKVVAGSVNGQDIYKYILRNQAGTEVSVISLGCTLTSIRVPDRNGARENVLLGYKDIKEYSQPRDDVLGSVIGRYAGFTEGNFTLDGTPYTIRPQNTDKHWNTFIWEVTEGDDEVTCHHASADGDSGYPGELDVNVTYRLFPDNELLITYRATVALNPTPINLMVAPVINLAGEGSGDINRHSIRLYSDKYIELTDDGSPTGKILDVGGTLYDLGKFTNLSEAQGSPGSSGGQCSGQPVVYSVRGAPGKKLTASVYEPSNGRTMTMYTDQPAVQLDPGCNLHNTGGDHPSRSGFSLSSLNYPQAILHANFPDSVLRPGSVYNHNVWYAFGTQD